MKKTTWIAQTAVCLALLIAFQLLTRSLGQLVTGSCVNLVLAVAALLGGVWSGVTVALVSPFCAYLLGIGPAFFPLVPCIALGNAVYAVLFGLLVGKCLQKKQTGGAFGCMALAALAKFAVLYAVLVRLVAPVIVPGSEAERRRRLVHLAAARHRRHRRRARLPDRAGAPAGARL